MQIPESLKDRMTLFEQTGRFVQRKDEIFVDSWLQVMIGQGLIPKRHHPLADEMSEQDLRQFLSQIENDHIQRVETIPTHTNYLSRISG